MSTKFVGSERNKLSTSPFISTGSSFISAEVVTGGGGGGGGTAGEPMGLLLALTKAS